MKVSDRMDPWGCLICDILHVTLHILPKNYISGYSKKKSLSQTPKRSSISERPTHPWFKTKHKPISLPNAQPMHDLKTHPQTSISMIKTPFTTHSHHPSAIPVPKTHPPPSYTLPLPPSSSSPYSPPTPLLQPYPSSAPDLI
jgi:hypothetical protein